MGKVTGFMEFELLEQAHEPVAQRKTHFREFITPLSQQEAKQQAAGESAEPAPSETSQPEAVG